MKKINIKHNLLAILICVICISKASAQSWLLAKHSSSSNYQTSDKIAVDRRGNVFITGGYNATSYFDNDTVLCLTHGNYFLAKYNASGNLLWIKTGGGISTHFANT